MPAKCDDAQWLIAPPTTKRYYRNCTREQLLREPWIRQVSSCRHATPTCLVSLAAARRGGRGFPDPGERRDALYTFQCEGAVHQECAARVFTRSATSHPFFLSSFRALRGATRKNAHSLRSTPRVRIFRTVPILDLKYHRKGIAPSCWHRVSGSSANPDEQR